MTYIVIGVCSLALIAAFFMPNKFKYIGKKTTVAKSHELNSYEANK
jgi:uncharacterized membrane protein YuzA (DUF378 family)